MEKKPVSILSVLKIWNILVAVFGIIGIVGFAIATIVGFGVYGAAAVVFWVVVMIYVISEAKIRNGK